MPLQYASSLSWHMWLYLLYRSCDQTSARLQHWLGAAMATLENQITSLLWVHVDGSLSRSTAFYIGAFFRDQKDALPCPQYMDVGYWSLKEARMPGALQKRLRPKEVSNVNQKNTTNKSFQTDFGFKHT
eukprot:5226635-Amphidinium_carterae.1